MRFLFVFIFSLFCIGCVATYPNKDVAGQVFPTVSGENLNRDIVAIPQAFLGNNTLLLIGYKQDAQFDIDRWLIGLDMTQTQVAVYELPTIAGMFPRMFSTVIDNGMRAGIPKSLWNGVITIYQDGEKIQAFTGNVNPNNARVVLLNHEGKILYFYDQGFAVSALKTLRTILAAESD